MKSYQQLYKRRDINWINNHFILILVFIGITIYYITETLSRKKYSFSTSSMEHEGAVSIKLEKEIFAFIFALQDPATYSEYVNETIYYFKANFITGIKDSTSQDFSWNYKEIKTGPCSIDMFSKKINIFNNKYKNNYCLYDINKKIIIVVNQKILLIIF